MNTHPQLCLKGHTQPRHLMESAPNFYKSSAVALFWRKWPCQPLFTWILFLISHPRLLTVTKPACGDHGMGGHRTAQQGHKRHLQSVIYTLSSIIFHSSPHCDPKEHQHHACPHKTAGKGISLPLDLDLSYCARVHHLSNKSAQVLRMCRWNNHQWCQSLEKG